MARGSNTLVKYHDDEVMELGGNAVVVFESKRNKVSTGIYKAGNGAKSNIVFWGDKNDLPEYREALLSENNIVPQIIRTKRDIILGGGLMTHTVDYVDGVRVIHEVPMPTEFEDFIENQESQYGGIEDMCNDLLKHGQYYVEMTTRGDDKIVTLKPHAARCVRAQKQNKHGLIPKFWVGGQWSKVTSQQELDEVKDLMSIPAYNRMADKTQAKFMIQGADRLMGGPYYYDPHYSGSETWIRVANLIPKFHESNLKNGFNIRYVIKVPEDFFLRSLSDAKRKDTEKLTAHVTAAKQQFKKRMNSFLSGVDNAGRGIIITKHIYKNIQKEWPELEIIPLTVDLKDEAMLKLYESSNQANTSSHGIPPVLAGLATGAKMTSGSEIRNLYNFWQISATPRPRKILLEPFKIAFKSMGFDSNIKLGFRNIEMTTTDKNPTGISEPKPTGDAV